MTVSTRIDGDVAHVQIDNPPVNATSLAVRQGLLDAARDVAASDARIVLLTCVGRTFVAGADIREFGAPPVAPHLPDVLTEIEASKVPWIAAIQGTALGGGLELALACTYRVVQADAKMGLPEVTLGLIPGAGGTVRLPRVIDPTEALNMIAGGRPIDAQKALNLGLIDAVFDDIAAGAIEFAQNNLGKARPTPLSERVPISPDQQFLDAANKIKARVKGQNAPAAAVDAVLSAISRPWHSALAAERETFLMLKQDPQSTALRYAFFAERSVSKVEKVKAVAPMTLNYIGVVGGGTMGAAIAAACLMADFQVTMIERDDSTATLGADRVTTILDGAVRRGKMTADHRAAAMNTFTVETDYAALTDADLVIEAVFEDMDVKAQVFAALDAVVGTDTVLASNTSYLDVEGLAAQTKNPERVIGLHFFSPAHVMKLLEVIIPTSAAPQAIATGLALGKKLHKITVPSGVCDGFIGNRIMSSYRQEADYMIVDGALPHEIDAAMKEFGFPIGVFEMQDLAGLDISWAMRKRRAATRDPSERYVTVADQLCAQGRFGRKTGQGWYDYSQNHKGEIDPAVTAIIEQESLDTGLKRSPLTTKAIMARILHRMQAEGDAILDEGIAQSAEAIDVVMVNGYGFPRWRGGPMFMKGQRQ